MEIQTTLTQQIRSSLLFWPDAETGGDFQYHQEIHRLLQSLPVDKQALFVPIQSNLFVG